MGKAEPDVSQWLKEAKGSENASKIGMYLTHNGVVRETPRAQVREGDITAGTVSGMTFSFDEAMVDEAVSEALTYEGVYFVRAWLNEGDLEVGDSIMYVLIGADIRPHAIDALTKLVGTIKTKCVKEVEKLS